MFNDVIFFYSEIDALKHRRPIRNSNTQQLSYLSYRMSAAVYKPGTGTVPTRGQSRPSLWLSYFISAILDCLIGLLSVSRGLVSITLHWQRVATPRMPLRTHLECALIAYGRWLACVYLMQSNRATEADEPRRRLPDTTPAAVYTLYQNLSYPSILHSTPSPPTYDFIKQFCTFFCLNPLLQSAWH